MTPLAKRPDVFWRKPSSIAMLLTLATAAAFWRVLTCDFVTLDDPFYVTNNAHVIRGLTGDGFIWAFTQIYFGGWQPVTWLSHMLDCQFYGLKPWGHHLTSLIVHLLNTILLFGILRRMTGAVWRSAICAALFALHPLHIESVAWVSDRKDVLSAFFFLLAVWAYAKFKVHGSKFKVQSYLLALLFFVLSLMSKQTAVTLPFVLLLLDYWPLNQPGDRGRKAPNWRRLVFEKIPFLVLTVIASVVAFVAQKADHAVGSLERFPLTGRILNAFVSYVRYLKKVFWPDDLTVFYPHHGTWPLPVSIAAMTLLAVATALVIWQAKSRRWLFVGWFWFLGTLIPVIGLVQIGSHAMADRYTYIPLVGIFIVLVWGAAEITARARFTRGVLAALATVAVVSCGIATAMQLRFWKDSKTLYFRALQVSSGNYLAHANLGTVFAQEKNFAEAETNFAAALRSRPDYPPAQLHFADLLALQDRASEAAAHYEEALRWEPEYEQAHFNYGSLLAGQGKLDLAEKHFRAALRTKPDWAELRFRLGYLLCLQGKSDEGTAQYLEAFRLNPQPEAHIHIGNAFARQKKWSEAAHHLRLAVKSFPNNPEIARDLAWMLATCDDPKTYNPTEAIQLAGRACELTGRRDASCLDVLAAAFSEARRFDDAAKTASDALALALVGEDDEMAKQIRTRLKNYLEGGSYRETIPPAAPKQSEGRKP